MASLPTCRCGESVVLLTSWTEKNPGRRFYRCRRCNFFRWFDPSVQPRSKAVINGLLRKVKECERLESGFNGVAVTDPQIQSATSVCSSANNGRSDMDGRVLTGNDLQQTGVIQIIVIVLCVIVGIVVDISTLEPDGRSQEENLPKDMGDGEQHIDMEHEVSPREMDRDNDGGGPNWFENVDVREWADDSEEEAHNRQNFEVNNNLRIGGDNGGNSTVTRTGGRGRLYASRDTRVLGGRGRGRNLDKGVDDANVATMEDDEDGNTFTYVSESELLAEVGWGSEEDMEDDEVRFPEFDIDRDLVNPVLEVSQVFRNFDEFKNSLPKSTSVEGTQETRDNDLNTSLGEEGQHSVQTDLNSRTLGEGESSTPEIELNSTVWPEGESTSPRAGTSSSGFTFMPNPFCQRSKLGVQRGRGGRTT
ncbi:hypothetical protein LINPERPRIM_LOCUS8509 [Linum perenne]